MMLALPATLAPPPPFPAVQAEQRRYEDVAPGVVRAEYDLRTSSGPLVIHIVVADLSDPTVHVRTALSQGLLTGSQAETVRSMALRTGAVAAVNGDFFDIDRSNAPTNVLVQDGVVLHPPGYGRPALGILPTGTAVIGIPALDPASGAPPAVTIDGSPVVQAVGGGPMLLRDGQPVDDPTAPDNGTDKVRFPMAGVGTELPSTLLLVEVDGHQPGYSVGLLRNEFAALFQGLGARDAMGLDSGGSATIVARPLGDAGAALLNRPSDGRERPVADALEVLSSAPEGPAARLVVRPRSIFALPGARVSLRVAAVDGGDHPAPLPAPPILTAAPADLGAVDGVSLQLSATAVGTGMLEVASGMLHTETPIEVAPRLQRLEIQAPTINPSPGAAVPLEAAGYDEAGRRVVVDGAVRWNVAGGGNLEGGVYTAPETPASAVVTAQAEGAQARLELGTGEHRVALPWQPAWFTFASYPAGAGSLTQDDECACLALHYDFTQGERAAYARTAIALGGHPVAFSLEVEGDAGDGWLRLRVADARGRQYALTLAQHINWSGWRRVQTPLPAGALVPLTIEDVYLVARDGMRSGTLRLRDPALTYPGTITPSPVIARPPQTR
ncbi:phosphodiester glycosidase family protein [bacterium]|nr:MAG: phosphodiester glycosidase family protein [bacterium]